MVAFHINPGVFPLALEHANDPLRVVPVAVGAVGVPVPAVPHLHPLLVTGTAVAGSPETLRRLHELVGDQTLTVEHDRLVSSENAWPWVTRFFEQGHSRVLVGTPGRLAEGDTSTATSLVDLTTTTGCTASSHIGRCANAWASSAAMPTIHANARIVSTTNTASSVPV